MIRCIAIDDIFVFTGHNMETKISTKNMTEFFNKKTVVSFFLSVLVVLIHIHSFDSYDFNGVLGSGLSYFGKFLNNGVTGVAIRLFFVISGVLFYRNYTYKSTVSKYRSRFKTLVVPYLFWCVLYTVAMMVLYLTPAKSLMVIENPFTFKNILLGVFWNYYYKSFWFILDLIVFTLLCPVFYTLLKNKYVGAIVIITTVVLYAFDIKIPETISVSGIEYAVFWRADSIVFYMIGAYIGLHCFDWFAKRKSKWIAVLGLITFFGCAIVRTICTMRGIAIEGAFHILFITVFCWATWTMFDLLSFEKKPKHFCEYSFMMFALNYYLGVYISKVLYLVLPKAQIFCLVNLLLTLIFEISFILLFSHLLKKHFPKIYSIITGGR